MTIRRSPDILRGGIAPRWTPLAALACSLAVPLAAHAVHLNPQGVGQVLIYPYYGVNGGNQTIISIVNTAEDVKAVKVRFLETRNSREVVDFNLYLSEFDVWTGAVFALDANGPANLVTLDNSCTVPAIRGNLSLPEVGGNRHVPFRNSLYSGERHDGGGQTVSRTREGHIEVIEMGTLRAGTDAHALADEATQRSNGVPVDCNALVAAWSGAGAWTAGGAASGTNAPSGGLFGSGSVVDVANGTMLSYNADALDGFFFTGNIEDDLHSAPGAASPNLNSARTGSLAPPVKSFALRGGSRPGIVTSSWNRAIPDDLAGADAVSATLMADSILNEYTRDARLGAVTEWVVTFPTRRFYVDDVAYGGVSSLPPLSGQAGVRTALPPFAGFGFTVIVNGARVGSLACENFDEVIADREGAEGLRFSFPGQFHFPQLCEAVNTVTFGQIGFESAILGTPASRTYNVDVPFVNGVARIRFARSSDTGNMPGFNPARSTTSADGDAYEGLPVTGFQAVSVVNRNATPGVLANYADAVRHRTTTTISPVGD